MTTQQSSIGATRPLPPTAIKYAIRYNDDSGEAISVSFDQHHRYYPNQVIITAGDDIPIHTEHLDWLIQSLSALRERIAGGEQ